MICGRVCRLVSLIWLYVMNVSIFLFVIGCGRMLMLTIDVWIVLLVCSVEMMVSLWLSCASIYMLVSELMCVIVVG